MPIEANADNVKVIAMSISFELRVKDWTPTFKWVSTVDAAADAINQPRAAGAGVPWKGIRHGGPERAAPRFRDHSPVPRRQRKGWRHHRGGLLPPVGTGAGVARTGTVGPWCAGVTPLLQHWSLFSTGVQSFRSFPLGRMRGFSNNFKGCLAIGGPLWAKCERQSS